MKKRIAKINRQTKETAIKIELNLDGSGKSEIVYPIPFMAHMLELFAKHGLFDLKILAAGDVEVDIHHLVEDTGLTLGEAFKKALGKKEKIERYGFAAVPMDESLAKIEAAIDISGRPHFTYSVKFHREPIYVEFEDKNLKYEIDSEMLREFFESFVYKAGITLHIDLVRGKNTHHKIEAIFKAFGVALSKACAINPRKKGIPSTKGRL